MAKETPKALEAFERYWALGPTRSLQKLAENDVEQKYTKSKVKTHLGQLSKWSTEYTWQARLKQRVIKEAEIVREQLRERALRFRQTVLTGLEVDVSRYIERLRITETEVMADDAAALEKLTKLYFQLAEEPLTEKRTEHIVILVGGAVRRALERTGMEADEIERFQTLFGEELQQVFEENGQEAEGDGG